MNLLARHRRKAAKRFAIKILAVHINRRNLMIVIRRIIVNSLRRIAAGSIERDLILSVRHLAASSLLVNRILNMEKLADTLRFAVSRDRVLLYKRHACKAGSRREVARQSKTAHATAVRRKIELVGKRVGRLFR